MNRSTYDRIHPMDVVAASSAAAAAVVPAHDAALALVESVLVPAHARVHIVLRDHDEPGILLRGVAD